MVDTSKEGQQYVANSDIDLHAVKTKAHLELLYCSGSDGDDRANQILIIASCCLPNV